MLSSLDQRIRLELAAELLLRGERISLRVQGASMLPSLFPGDVLTIRRCDPREIVAGDIVIFRREGLCIAHRVSERMTGSTACRLRTRGDALRNCDPPVSESEVLGRVTHVERNGRRRPPPRLGPVRTLVAGLVQRSHWAARALVAAHSRF
ncbi:MAG TPA: S24/S26 family peptidase [Candidatus Binatia bacterium]|nr:S24/S26 family peptidase [Candidatus Binatia bacterium]